MTMGAFVPIPERFLQCGLEMTAHASNLSTGDVVLRVCRLIQHCWAKGAANIGQEELIGLNPMHLETYGVLKKEDAGWTVLPATPYLRSIEGGRKGGLKRAKNKTGTLQPPLEQTLDLIPKTKEKNKPMSDSQKTENHDALEVFEYWKQVHKKTGKTAFDSKRKLKVLQRLRDGYSISDLKAAIDGCAKTPHNMGQNEQGQIYNDLELICRDAVHVDRFISNASTSSPPSTGGSTPPSSTATKKWEPYEPPLIPWTPEYQAKKDADEREWFERTQVQLKRDMEELRKKRAQQEAEDAA